MIPEQFQTKGEPVPAATCHGCLYRIRQAGSVPGSFCSYPAPLAPCTPSQRKDGKNIAFRHQVGP